MIYIRRFIDKVSASIGTQSKTLVLPMEEAKGLRDELDRLLIDNYELLQKQSTVNDAIKVELTGGKW